MVAGGRRSKRRILNLVFRSGADDCSNMLVSQRITTHVLAAMTGFDRGWLSGAEGRDHRTEIDSGGPADIAPILGAW